MTSRKSSVNPEQDNIRRVYGRRQSRPLNESRQSALDTLLPALGIPPESITQAHDLDPLTLFNFTPEEMWLEIGFGSGEHVSGLMRRHGERAYIGAEPFINGMSAFLKDIENDDHKNIRVHMDDAVMLASSLKPESLDGIYILNPDPWHKKRHWKRRIVRPETLDIYARILKPGGKLIMSSDVPDMSEWMFTHTYNHPAFTWTAKRANDWRIAPENWITTKYEVKGAKNAKVMSYLIFERNSL
jgi:tRNA (guanine-N7-)-methyltransferase